MATQNLFDDDDMPVVQSNQSSDSDFELEPESRRASAKPEDEGEDSDIEFLFGTKPQRKEKKSKKSSSRWQKELERRMRETDRHFIEAETVQFEITQSLDRITEHFERRQGVESEMLALFSNLLSREHFSVKANDDKGANAADNEAFDNLHEAHADGSQDIPADGSPNSPLTDTTSTATEESRAASSKSRSHLSQSTSGFSFADKPSTNDADTEKAMEKMMKKLIRTTFRGRAPEGRFGNLVKPTDEHKKPKASGNPKSVLTVCKEALSNMQDLNTLLSREREGDFVELDGVPLYKHTRYATMYIFEGNLVVTYILPLCEKILQAAAEGAQDFYELIQEVVYFLYQLAQPPSEAWYKYWLEAQPHYRELASSSECKEVPQLAAEVKRRARLVWHYLNGMINYRASLMSSNVWTLIGEFRMRLQKFEKAGYRTTEQSQRVEYLKQRQQAIAQERDAILADIAGSDDEMDADARTALVRLRKDQGLLDERKQRIKQLRSELYNVNEELSSEREAHMDAQQQTRLHCKTVRLLVSHLLAVPGDGLLFLGLLQESGLIALLRDDILACFGVCKRAFTVSDMNIVNTHPAYLNEAQRELLWDSVRLVHALVVGVDIGRFLRAVYNGVRPPEMQLHDVLVNSGEEPGRSAADNEALLDLIRLNPKMARMVLRGAPNVGRFVINERFSGTRTQHNYEHWFRFPNLAHLQTPFEVISGLSANGAAGVHAVSAVSTSLAQSLQLELHNLIGIDSDFEHCHWSDNDADSVVGDSRIYYELGLLLSLCLGDLERGSQDRYFRPSDHRVIFDLHSWIVTYYRCLYVYVREKLRLEGRRAPSETFVALGLRRYLGGESLCAQVACSYLWQLIRTDSLAKSAHLGATSALRAFLADLSLFHMMGDIREYMHAVRIYHETLASYFKGDMRAVIFWILRNFKHLSHPTDLFCFALSSLHMLRQVLRPIGSMTFTVDRTRTEALGYASDSDVSDDGSAATKTIEITANSVFSSLNRSADTDDILYNGSVVYNCVAMLANFRTNSAHLNDILVTHLEAVPAPMLYDVKYFYVFRDVISDRRVWHNARWRWIGSFCARVLESFFDSWLGLGNRMLPAELFFNKCSGATKGPFRPFAREHVTPLLRGYEHCEFLSELLRRPDSDIYELSKELRGVGRGDRWEPEEDRNLVKYYNKFHFLEDPAAYIAELLGRRSADVQRRIEELNLTASDPRAAAHNAATTAVANLKELLRKFVAAFHDLAIKVGAELHQSLSDALELRQLGGAGTINLVEEPKSATPKLLRSPEFKAIMDCLSIKPNWELPEELSLLPSLLEVLINPASYTSPASDDQGTHGGAGRRRAKDSGSPPTTTDSDGSESSASEAPPFTSVLVTSREIAELTLDLMRSLQRVNAADTLEPMLQKAIELVESAALFGRAETHCQNLPEDPEALAKLQALLTIADVGVFPPMFVCNRLYDETVALDRLQVALNLCRHPVDRIESLVRVVVRQPSSGPVKRRQSSKIIEDTDFEDSMEGLLTGSHEASIDDHLDRFIDLHDNPPADAPRPGTMGDLRVAASQAAQVPSSREAHRSGLRTVLSGLRQRLIQGDSRIDAASLMSACVFSDWDAAFATLRSICRSLGASEEFSQNTLWLVWPSPDAVGSAVDSLTGMPPKRSRQSRRPPPPAKAPHVAIGVQCPAAQPARDFSALRRLEVDRDLPEALPEGVLLRRRRQVVEVDARVDWQPARSQQPQKERDERERRRGRPERHGQPLPPRRDAVDVHVQPVGRRDLLHDVRDGVAQHAGDEPLDADGPEGAHRQAAHRADGADAAHFLAQLLHALARRLVAAFAPAVDVERQHRGHGDAQRAHQPPNHRRQRLVGDLAEDRGHVEEPEGRVEDVDRLGAQRVPLLRAAVEPAHHHRGDEDREGPAQVAQRDLEEPDHALPVARREREGEQHEHDDDGEADPAARDPGDAEAGHVLQVSHRHLDLDGERHAEQDDAAAELQNQQRALHELGGLETQRQQDVVAVLLQHPDELLRRHLQHLRVVPDQRAGRAEGQHRDVAREDAHAHRLLRDVVAHARLGGERRVDAAAHDELVHARADRVRPDVAAFVQARQVPGAHAGPQKVQPAIQRQRREGLRHVRHQKGDDDDHRRGQREVSHSHHVEESYDSVRRHHGPHQRGLQPGIPCFRQRGELALVRHVGLADGARYAAVPRELAERRHRVAHVARQQPLARRQVLGRQLPRAPSHHQVHDVQNVLCRAPRAREAPRAQAHDHDGRPQAAASVEHLVVYGALPSAEELPEHQLQADHRLHHQQVREEVGHQERHPLPGGVELEERLDVPHADGHCHAQHEQRHSVSPVPLLRLHAEPRYQRHVHVPDARRVLEDVRELGHLCRRPPSGHQLLHHSPLVLGDGARALRARGDFQSRLPAPRRVEGGWQRLDVELRQVVGEVV
ncbi:pb-reticulocyte binding protein, putative [Babesia caballi]|uniref:Pb-reticulocyte binding protein, putative n=1 Tax=Babesia caballi TaxID=5871 RepID=A0AAV4LYT4_BABCB|nr:pb-reticulocyte binding protein, putative [Babesia caballi]